LWCMMNSKTAQVTLILILIAAVAATAGWYQGRVQLRNLKQSELAPIAALLKDDQDLLRVLQTEVSDSGILASYLAKIRADGLPKHAEMKRKLDALAENNTAIVTLIKAYAPFAMTPAFVAEADEFRNYASAWRDRWNSVMELFMAGGNYPVAEVPYPTKFSDAVRVEMEADQHTF
jgi:hypothetical protein